MDGVTWPSIDIVLRCRRGGASADGFFFFSSRRRHTRSDRDWSSDVCSSDLAAMLQRMQPERRQRGGVRMAVDPEHAALFVEMIRVSAAGGQHPLPASGIWPLRDRKSVV